MYKQRGITNWPWSARLSVGTDLLLLLPSYGVDILWVVSEIQIWGAFWNTDLGTLHSFYLKDLLKKILNIVGLILFVFWCVVFFFKCLVILLQLRTCVCYGWIWFISLLEFWKTVGGRMGILTAFWREVKYSYWELNTKGEKTFYNL